MPQSPTFILPFPLSNPIPLSYYRKITNPVREGFQIGWLNVASYVLLKLVEYSTSWSQRYQLSDHLGLLAYGKLLCYGARISAWDPSLRESWGELIARPGSPPLLLEHEKSRQTERLQGCPLKAARSAGVGGDSKIMEDWAVLARNTRAVVNNADNCNCVQLLVCAGGVNNWRQPSGSLCLNCIQLLACAGGRSSTQCFSSILPQTFFSTSIETATKFQANFLQGNFHGFDRKYNNFHANFHGWKFK